MERKRFCDERKSILAANEVTIDDFEIAVEGSALGKSGVAELAELEGISVESRATDDGRIDSSTLSVVRGLEYYTGPVFEVELTFSTDSKDGSPRFGSVGGGGRYDGLVSRFRGEPVPATGFSIGVSRLAAALEYLGKLDGKPEPGPVVVTVFDKDRLADYQNMVARLRAANIRAELYLGNPRNLGNQLKYADKRNAPCVVIQGGDEKAKGEVTIKDLIVGAELAKLEKGREEHLQKQARSAARRAGGRARRGGARGAGAARARFALTHPSGSGSELRVKPPGENRHRPAIGVVGRIGDELIIEAQLRRRGQSVAVIGLDDLLDARDAAARRRRSGCRARRRLRNAACTPEMPLTTPATPKVSSGRPHCLPLIETPAEALRSMSVKSHGSTLPSAQPARANTPTVSFTCCSKFTLTPGRLT